MEERRRRWLRILVPAFVVGTAAVLMLGSLSSPGRIVFDEVYYVNDARDMLEFGVEQGFVVHPPLGKMLIAFSIWLFGDTPFGWRALGGMAGVGTVWLTYLMGRRLFGRVTPAGLAALLVAIDGVFLVQAQTAMLDIYLAFFVALGAWALVAHVQRTREADLRWLEADPGPHDRLPRRDQTLLALAGVAFGLAIATKWSGLLALGAGGLTVIATELTRRRRLLGSPWRRPWRGVALIGVALVAVPMAVYLVTWAPWFVDYGQSYEASKSCEEPSSEACANTPLPSKAAALWRFHGRIANFHSDLEADHSYRAPAYTWPVLARPVVFYYETCDEDRQNRVPKTNDDGEVEIPEPCIVDPGQAGEMLAVGNPALWWGFLPATALLIAGLVRRDPRAAIPLTFVAAQFVPWLMSPRAVFSFYAVPLVPFLALGLAATIARIGDRRPLVVPLIGAVLGGGVATGLVGIWDLAAGAPTRAVYGLVAAAGAAIGSAVATWRFAHRDRLDGTPGWSTAATWVTIAVLVAAVGLALFFLPIWLGIPLDADAIRSRWWFRGWI